MVLHQVPCHSCGLKANGHLRMQCKLPRVFFFFFLRTFFPTSSAQVPVQGYSPVQAGMRLARRALGVAGLCEDLADVRRGPVDVVGGGGGWPRRPGRGNGEQRGPAGNEGAGGLGPECCRAARARHRASKRTKHAASGLQRPPTSIARTTSSVNPQGPHAAQAHKAAVALPVQRQLQQRRCKGALRRSGERMPLRRCPQAPQAVGQHVGPRAPSTPVRARVRGRTGLPCATRRHRRALSSSG